jgi:hypothetical protein
MTTKFNADKLRPLAYFNEPDPRSGCFSMFDKELKDFRQVELSDHHQNISEIILNESVPENVASQFEVVRNLYLYSWVVYRFLNISEHHALACLELALKCRYESCLNEIAHPQKHASLKKLLKYAIESGDIRNEGFTAWHLQVFRNSQNREEARRLQRVIQMGNSHLLYDDAVNVIVEEDRDFDYVSSLAERLPILRNLYAHGSDMLDFRALNTIRTVSEIINQLFPKS